MKITRMSIIISLLITASIILSLTGCGEFGNNRDENNESQVERVDDSASEEDIHAADARVECDVVFAPAGGFKPTKIELESAKEILEARLDADKTIIRYQVDYNESNSYINVSMALNSDDSLDIIQKIGKTSFLTFKAGKTYDCETLFDGSAVEEAIATVDQMGQYVVSLKMNDAGTEALKQATTQQLNDVLSVWLDDTCVTAPAVYDVITDGNALISGDFTPQEAIDVATYINAGALPFDITVMSNSTHDVSSESGT